MKLIQLLDVLTRTFSLENYTLDEKSLFESLGRLSILLY